MNEADSERLARALDDPKVFSRALDQAKLRLNMKR